MLQERNDTIKMEKAAAKHQFEEELKSKDKKDFVMHTVTPSDSLNLICLKYDVSKDVVRMANDFTGDTIFGKKVLKIPFTSKSTNC